MGLLNKFLLFIVFFMFLSLVSADIEVKMYVEEEFSEGELVYFDYGIYSDQESEVVYVPYILCEDNALPLANEERISLGAGEYYAGNYSYKVVDEELNIDNCEAIIEISHPYYIIKTKEFHIIPEKEIDISLFACKDSLCLEEAKIFVEDEYVYLDYETSMVDLRLDFALTYPDDSVQRVNLPDRVRADQIGTYQLEVLASKYSYRNKEEKIQFGVIEKEVDIEGDFTDSEIEEDNEEEVVEEEEREDWFSENILWIILGFLVVLIIIIVVVLISVGKNRGAEYSPKD